LVLLANTPYDDEDVPDEPICSLLKRSLANQQTVLTAITRLGKVLATTGEPIGSYLTTAPFATKGEMSRRELKGEEKLLEWLQNEGGDNSPEEFFRHLA
jgi:hypothetical protein